MSYVTLAQAKEFLNVFHSDDDDNIQLLLDGAEKEAFAFMDRGPFNVVPADVKVGILMLLQANYHANPEEQDLLRRVAENRLMPHRCKLGI